MDILKVVECVYTASGIAAAIYVFIDIKGQGRTRRPAHLLWTGFALLCPVFCLILYLLFRDDESGRTGQAAPAGQGKLKCPACGCLLAEDWKFCPMCRAEITEDMWKEGAACVDGKETEMEIVMKGNSMRETQETKWSMRLSFATVVIAPVIICLIMFGQMTPRTTQPAALVQYGSVETAELEQDIRSSELNGWLKACSQKASDGKTAYMLLQSVADEDDDRYTWDYLVLYVQGPTELTQKDGVDYGIGKRTFRMESAVSTGDQAESGTGAVTGTGTGTNANETGYLVMGRFKHLGDVENKLTIDGKQVEIQMEESDFDLIKALKAEWDEPVNSR